MFKAFKRMIVYFKSDFMDLNCYEYFRLLNKLIKT